MAIGQAAYMRQWQKDNPEKRRANQRKYRLAHPELIKAAARRRTHRPWGDYDRDWRKANPTASAAYKRNRRARLAGAPGAGVSRLQWRATIQEYAGRCAYCGELLPLAMEHVDPLSKGGAHEPENVAPACKGCNSSKGDKPLLFWLAVRGQRWQ